MAQYLGSKTLDSSSNSAGYINYGAGASTSLARTMPIAEHSARPTDFYRQSGLLSKPGAADNSYATTYTASYLPTGYTPSATLPASSVRASSVPRGTTYMTQGASLTTGHQPLQSSYTVNTALQRAPVYQQQQYSSIEPRSSAGALFNSSSSSGGYGGSAMAGGLRAMPAPGVGMGQSILANVLPGSAGSSGVTAKPQVQRGTVTSGFSHLLRVPTTASSSLTSTSSLLQRPINSYAANGYARAGTGQDVAMDSSRRLSSGGGLLPRPPITSNVAAKPSSLTGYSAGGQYGSQAGAAASSSHAFQAYNASMQLPVRPSSMNGAASLDTGYAMRQARPTTPSQAARSSTASTTTAQYAAATTLDSGAQYGSVQQVDRWTGAAGGQVDRRLTATASGSPVLTGLAASAAGLVASTSAASTLMPLSIPQQSGFTEPSPSAGSNSISPYLRPSASSVYGGTDTPNSPGISPAPTPQGIAAQHTVRQQSTTASGAANGLHGSHSTTVEAGKARAEDGHAVSPSPCRPRQRMGANPDAPAAPPAAIEAVQQSQPASVYPDAARFQDASSRVRKGDQESKQAGRGHSSSSGGRLSRHNSGQPDLDSARAASPASGTLLQLSKAETVGSRGSSRGSLSSTLEPAQLHTPPKARNAHLQTAGVASSQVAQEQPRQALQHELQQQQPWHEGQHQQQQQPGDRRQQQQQQHSPAPAPATATVPALSQDRAASTVSSRSQYVQPPSQSKHPTHTAASPIKLRAHALQGPTSDISDTDSDHEASTQRHRHKCSDRGYTGPIEGLQRAPGDLSHSMLVQLRCFDFSGLAAGQGCVGLQNLGNTCFMNSILQVLNAVPELVAWCHTKVELPQAKTNIASAYVRLVRDMWKSARMGVVSPNSLLTWLGRTDSRWSHGSQQDAQELLHALLEALQAECNRVQGKPVYKELSGKGNETEQAAEADAYAGTWHDSIVDDIFGGLLQSTIQCQACQKQSHCFEPFLDLSVPIPAGGRSSSVSVQDCLKAFVEEERLEGSDSVRCEACKKACPHTKRLQIWRPPLVLVLTLKRFAQRGSGNLFSRFRSASKNTAAVALEVDKLKLSPYCNPAGLKSQSGTALQYPAYQLVSISHHSGSLEGGHYTASGRSAVDGQWYNFNDSHVRPESPPSGTSSSAYVLAYRLLT